MRPDGASFARFAMIDRMNTAEDSRRITAWLRTVAEARADRVVQVPGGAVVLHSDYPAAHDHNRMLVWEPVGAAEAAAAVDDVLGGAGLTHRQIDVQSAALTERLAPGLIDLGYERSDELVMLFTGEVSMSAGSVGIEVVELDASDRAAVASADWRAEQPDFGDDVVDQLGARIRTLAGAVEPRFFGVRDQAGRVVARTDLYVRGAIAQIEEVMTDPTARNRGYASALVRRALRGAMAAHAETIFLVADADDWPSTLYRKLGFADLFTAGSFTR